MDGVLPRPSVVSMATLAQAIGQVIFWIRVQIVTSRLFMVYSKLLVIASSPTRPMCPEPAMRVVVLPSPSPTWMGC